MLKIFSNKESGRKNRRTERYGGFYEGQKQQSERRKDDGDQKAADAQFAEKPYHMITLTTIAEQLSWSGQIYINM